MLGRIIGLGTAIIMVIGLLVFAPPPAHAGGVSGSFPKMDFPGCDIRLSGATIDVSAGTVRVQVKSGTKVLEDSKRAIASASITQFTIAFVDFAKPPHTGISVTVDVDGAIMANLSGDYPGPCLNLDLTNIPSYLRDGRADPKAGDRLAIWCNKDSRTIDVWGVGNDSIGYPLTTFTDKELAAAGPQGVKREVKNMGAVSAAMDNQGNLWIAWNGGPYGANGRDSFGKALNCKFGQS